jgi:hypothetical protein
MPDTPQQTTGFDAPVFDAKDDHLNRWPLARQIYNVAANGPADWSARIGVYGEWGTGKTSVLKFVSAMAEADGHIVVWFDPWGYSSKPNLWHAFVMKCCDTIEGKLGGLTAAGDVRKKSYFKKGRDLLATVTKKVPGDTASAITGGLDLLTGAFSFGPDDLKKLHADLKGRRVIVLIDDLDRTAAELVPEILYALKEVMDIPGFSFVCGFDPVVVGEVLGTAHKGFGDGLKFLEKIIDYPVWLPPATAEGLMKIALADRSQHCDFVPEAAMRDVLDLLQQNPRAVRQFVRLAAMLKDQKARHYDRELRWSIILTANAIKVRFPRLAPFLLGEREFFKGIGMTHVLDGTTQKGQEVNTNIEKHIDESLAKSSGSKLDEPSKKALNRAMRRFCGHIDLWLGSTVDVVMYQASIAEAPHAVTWKEFDGLLNKWATDSTSYFLSQWIAEHARAQNASEGAVASELTAASLDRYLSELKAADEAFVAKEKSIHRQQATVAFDLLKAMVLEVGDQIESLKSREWLPLESVIENLAALADTVQLVHRAHWPRTESLLMGLVKEWPASLDLLLPAVRKIDPRAYGRVDGKGKKEMGSKLNAIIDKRLAAEMAARFKEAGFVENVVYRRDKQTEIRGLFLDINGPLWTTQRKTVLAILRTAKANPSVQENAYAFLDWLRYLFEKKEGLQDEARARSLASNPDVMQAIWKSATARPFQDRHAYRLRKLPDLAKELGVDLALPTWWQPAIAKAIAIYEKQADYNKAADGEAGS